VVLGSPLAQPCPREMGSASRHAQRFGRFGNI
jgi:hypothetical protein